MADDATPAVPGADPRLKDLLENPTWFLDGLDLASGAASLTRTERADVSGAVFLDDRWDRGGAARARLPLSALAGFIGRHRPAVIWHSAFCCSTLVASLLDVPGAALALKEPKALTDLAEIRRVRAPGTDERLTHAVLTHLGRRRSPDEAVVIKPSNGANALLPEAATASGPVLFLYSSCRDFILSVVSGGPDGVGAESRKRFVRSLLLERAAPPHPTLPLRPADLAMITDLQAAALVWHAQMQEFRAAARRLGPARARSQDCEVFLNDPAGTLKAIDRFMDLNIGEARLADALAGGGMDRYAKQPSRAYDTSRRRATLDAAAAELGGALEAVVEWSYSNRPATAQGDPIGAPLV
jgi:hypothetical protein